MKKGIIIAILIFCCIITTILLGGGGYWAYNNKSTVLEKLGEFKILPPKQILLYQATSIQVPEVDPSTLSGKWSVTPPDCTGTSNIYSFSMDIQLASGWSKVGGSTYNLFENGDSSPVFGINNGGDSTATWYEKNGVYIGQKTVGTSTNGKNYQVYKECLSTKFTTVTVVCDGTTINLYINGVLNKDITDATDRTNTSGILWTKGDWKWKGLTGAGGEKSPLAGLVKIKNFYWWSNKALSSKDISDLIETPDPDPKTSTYIPEPYSKF
jgi:hypothetical protein